MRTIIETAADFLVAEDHSESLQKARAASKKLVLTARPCKDN